MKKRFARKAKLALAMAMALAGGTVFTSCGLSDIKNNLIAGALGAVKTVTQNWVTASLPAVPK